MCPSVNQQVHQLFTLFFASNSSPLWALLEKAATLEGLQSREAAESQQQSLEAAKILDSG